MAVMPTADGKGAPAAGHRALLARRRRLGRSACHEGDTTVSGVLGALRLSLGTPTTGAEIDRAAKSLIAAWQKQSC
ncbi:MAG: hypothetical protein OEU50_18295 [Gammaproteobacteria bacterium]|nr:hypothetical protein [Gammaproteobacteria bacterium]